MPCLYTGLNPDGAMAKTTKDKWTLRKDVATFNACMKGAKERSEVLRIGSEERVQSSRRTIAEARKLIKNHKKSAA